MITHSLFSYYFNNKYSFMHDLVSTNMILNCYFISAAKHAPVMKAEYYKR